MWVKIEMIEHILTNLPYSVQKKITNNLPKSVKEVVPTAVEAWWNREIIRQAIERDGRKQFARDFIQQYGQRVRRGPFEGLVLPEKAMEKSDIVPDLIGSTECELHRVLDEVRTREFDQIINIGSAIGYYAVGLARMFPEVPVWAFDPSLWCREVTRETASLNKVDGRVNVCSTCTSKWLSNNLTGKSLIFCDCEGCEFEILNPNKVSNLKEAAIVVELHGEDLLGEKEKDEEFIEAYSDSHRCKAVKYNPPGKSDQRVPSYYPELEGFSEERGWNAVSDNRGGSGSWLFATPKSHFGQT